MRVSIDDTRLYAPCSLVEHTPVAQLKRPVLLALAGEDRVLHELDDLLRLLLLASKPDKGAPPDAEAFWTAEQRDWLRARDQCPRRAPGVTGPLLRMAEVVADEPYMRALTDPGTGPLTRKPFTSAQIEPVELVADGAPPRHAETLHRLLVRAALDGFHARAQTLLDMRGDPSFAPPLPGGDYGFSALMVAARGGDRRMLQVLLRGAPLCGVGPNLDGVTPLMAVASVADLLPVADADAMLRLLLDFDRAQAPLHDGEGYTALARLVQRPTADTLRLLRCMHDAGARCAARTDAHDAPHAPLAIAAATGREDVVRFLLGSMGAVVEDGGACVRQAVTHSPLMAAVAAGHAGVVRCLLEFKADPADVDLQGNSAFHQAARHGHGPEMLAALMGPCAFEDDASEQGAIHQPNLAGQSALMVAVHHGHLRTARALLDVTHCDAERRLLVLSGDAKRHTPLHRAASMGHTALLAELLRHAGADLDVKDRHGRTPLDRALAQDEMDTAKQLLERGARVTDTMLREAVESVDDARLGLLLRHLPPDAALADLPHEWLVYAFRIGRRYDAHARAVLDALLAADPDLGQRQGRVAPAAIAVACGLDAIAERLLAEGARPRHLLLHIAAYNLDHFMLRVLLKAQPALDDRSEQTGRTPLLCLLAQMVRMIVPANAAVADEAQCALLDTAEEARDLVAPLRALRFEALEAVMLPIGGVDDGLDAVRLLVRAGARLDAPDAHGRDASHYVSACVSVARQFNRPSAFVDALVALGGGRPPKRARHAPKPR